MVSHFHCVGEAIKKFMAYYRSTFPTATILPKMHFLEDHAMDFIKKWVSWRVSRGIDPCSIQLTA